MTPVLQSFIGGQWIGQQGAQALRSAINGQTIAQTHAEAVQRLLYAILEALGELGSKHDEARVRVEVVARDGE
jgi:hypothetical protein